MTRVFGAVTTAHATGNRLQLTLAPEITGDPDRLRRTKLALATVLEVANVGVNWDPQSDYPLEIDGGSNTDIGWAGAPGPINDALAELPKHPVLRVAPSRTDEFIMLLSLAYPANAEYVVALTDPAYFDDDVHEATVSELRAYRRQVLELFIPGRDLRNSDLQARLRRRAIRALSLDYRRASK